MKTLKAAGRVPRQIDGPFTLLVPIAGTSITLTAERDPPQEGLRVPGSGSIFTASVTVVDDATNADLAKRAQDFLTRATNRGLFAVAFLAGNQKFLPALADGDFERVSVTLDVDGEVSDLPLAAAAVPRSQRVETEAGVGGAQRHIDALGAHLDTCSDLWHDVVDAYYDGRDRECVVLARALVELAWSAACDKAVVRHQQLAAANATAARILEAFKRGVISNERTPLPERLDTHAAALFGFSFSRDWTPEEWGRLNTAFDIRHDVAHEGAIPRREQVWLAISMARKVTEKLSDLLDALPPAPLAPPQPPANP